jgi:hypothetical protein
MGCTFVIFLITLMYLLALWSLLVIRTAPILSFVVWVLPVKTLPIRSIGLMSEIILFVGLILGQLFSQFVGFDFIGRLLLI